MESSDPSCGNAGPGNPRVTAGVIRSCFDKALLSLKQAIEAAKCGNATRQDALKRIEAAYSGLQEIDSLCSQVLHEFSQEEKSLEDRHDVLNQYWDHLEAVITEVKKSLEWIEDPQDPSTSLKNIKDPKAVGRLVEERYRELQQSSDHFSNLNSRLRQDHENVSKEAARLKADLHVQTRSRQEAQNENAKLAKVVGNTKAELDVVLEDLRREKEYGQNLKTKKDSLKNSNKKRKGVIKTLQAEIGTQAEHMKQIQEENDEYSQTLADLKAALEEAEDKLHIETGRAQEARTEKSNPEKETAKLKANLQELQALLKSTMAEYERRLEAESIKPKGIVAELQQALTDKDEFANDNKDLKSSNEALQADLKQEKLLRQTSIFDYESQLKAKSAEFEGIVAELQQALKDKDEFANDNKDLKSSNEALQADLKQEKLLRQTSIFDYESQLKAKSAEFEGIVAELQDSKEDYEERLRVQAADYAATISVEKKETTVARNQVGELRVRNENDQRLIQRLIQTLSRTMADRTKETEDMRALCDSSTAQNNRLSQELQNIVEACDGSSLNTQDSHQVRTLRDAEATERCLEGEMDTSRPHVQDMETRRDVDCDDTHSTRITCQESNTSRKRGPADLDPNTDPGSFNSKRPRIEAGLPQPDSSREGAMANLEYTASAPAISTFDSSPTSEHVLENAENAASSSAIPTVDSSPTSEHIVPIAERASSLPKGLVPFLIHDDATEDDVSKLLQRHLEQSSTEKKETVIPVIALKLANLRLQDLTPTVKILLRVVYRQAEGEARRLLMSPGSLTSGVLESSIDHTAVAKPNECPPARTFEPESLTTHNQDRNTKSREVQRPSSPAVAGHELQTLKDPVHEKVLEQMRDRWGPFCGIPEEWRSSLKVKDASQRLRALYDKVALVVHDPIEYLWKQDGLLTQACKSKGNINLRTIAGIQKELESRFPELGKLQGQRARVPGRDVDVPRAAHIYSISTPGLRALAPAPTSRSKSSESLLSSSSGNWTTGEEHENFNLRVNESNGVVRVVATDAPALPAANHLSISSLVSVGEMSTPNMESTTSHSRLPEFQTPTWSASDESMGRRGLELLRRKP